MERMQVAKLKFQDLVSKLFVKIREQFSMPDAQAWIIANSFGDLMRLNIDTMGELHADAVMLGGKTA